MHRDGELVGSDLIGQAFTRPVVENGQPKLDADGIPVIEPDPSYFQCRPSAAGAATTRWPRRHQPRPREPDLLSRSRSAERLLPSRWRRPSAGSAGRGPGQRLRARPPHLPGVRAATGRARRPRAWARGRPRCATRRGAHPGADARLPRRASGECARAQPRSRRTSPYVTIGPPHSRTRMHTCDRDEEQRMARGSCASTSAPPRRGQDLRDARRGAPPRRARHRRRRRLRRDPRPAAHRRDARRSGDRAATRASPTAAPRSPRWTWTPFSPGTRRSPWSTSWRTPTCPGSRNEKRWQDVEELLDGRDRRHHHGQHPAPRVAQRRRREDHRCPAAGTVPDAVVRGADQIELVDMSPEALRRRMAHGNSTQPRRSTPRWPTTSASAT